uniref:BCL2 associated transcription factor 1 n=1 Tax=Nomascus leucogenys TaxID=61853 RepID=A0A2I3H458_NOMLE
MGRSNSRSHSSRSKSRSQSRSHSRRKRYSSRSRSRTYSRSCSRDRMYSRDDRCNYRNNRGMKRPYGYRGRGRGYYQGGGGSCHRGGYRPVWNRRHSRSPRRGYSHSRSPKRRFISSQRSRSRSRRSHSSSRSPSSSSSRSSSPYGKSPVSKRRGPLKSKAQEELKDTFEHDPSESIDEFNKPSVTSSDIWPGFTAYDNSPRSPHSPSPIATPPSQSSSCSDAPMLSTVHSAKNIPSQHSQSIQHSPERSGPGFVGNGSSRYSPSQNSPIHHIPSGRSPAKTIAPQNALRDESRGHSSFYPDGGDRETAKTGKFTDEESRVFLLDRGNARDKEASKEKGSEKGRSGKQKFNDSEGDDTEETEDYRQFRKSVLADQGKSFATTSHWNTEEEGLKYKSKVSLKGNRESGGFREEKNYKLKEAGYVVERPRTTKDKHKEEDKNSERITVKKETQSPEQVKSEKLKDLFDYNPPLYKNLDSTFREESPLRIKMTASDSHRPEVKLKMAPVPLDDSNRPASLTKDRLLASTLVHSIKKDTSRSFIQHIVSLFHHVKEQYFKSAAMTLNKRFTSHRKATEEHSYPEEAYPFRSQGIQWIKKAGKSPKDYKEYKSYKDDSKHKSREQDHSRSSSSSPSTSSPSSREEKGSKKEREEEFKTHHEMKEYSGFAGVRTFFRIRDDGVDYWTKRGRGRGTFQRGRGCSNFEKSGSSPKWTHDKYQGDGIVGDEEETMENNEEKNDRLKEEKER